MTDSSDDDSLAHTLAPPIAGDGATLAQPGAPSGHALTLEDASRYERLEVLGEGGMGKVWLLRDERIGRRVAQKELLDGRDDAGMRDRFLREARLQGQLEHPAVVPVYDLGQGGDGQLFFTMKRVRGVTLAQVISGRRARDAATLERFSQRRLLSAFSQVCLAVEFAHSRGVVHRDLKPENLMLGDHGEIYVLDWGVARVLHEDPRELDADVPTAVAQLTETKSGLIGTPGYMAPEQLRGGIVGPRADVFALGSILFELLTHEPLLGIGSPMQRVTRTLESVNVAALIAEAGADVAPELVALCERATIADPDGRIASCRELHNALEAWLDGERDAQVRRELAERHLATSRAAMRASVDDVDAHKLALRETGRALALVPDHPEARAIILSLFASSPTAIPPEVGAAIEVERAQQARITARGGAAGMASMLLFLPALILLGIRNWVGVWIFFAMVIVAAVISGVVARQPTRSELILYLTVFFNNVVFALAAGLYGPLVLVPSMVITNTVVFSLHLDGRARMWAIASACLAVALPVTLSLLGVTPDNYVPAGDGILLRPLWLELRPVATVLFLTLGTLIAIVNGALSVARVRDSLTIAERRLHMQRWQLQQLLPEDP